MKMRKIKYLFGFLILGITVCRCQRASGEQRSTQKRPNIIVVMADDHSQKTISSYGSKMNQTPNIDRLAAGGMRFSDSFVTNSLCSPERATLLTGKYSHKNGQLYIGPVFDGSQQTFPKLLQAAGYNTAIVGKWHLKSTPTGFDYWKVLPGQGDYYNPDFIEMGDTLREQGYITDIITDQTINWINQQKDKKNPFLAIMTYKAPHRTRWPGPDHLNYKDNTYIPEPRTLLDDKKEGDRKIAREATMDIKNTTWLSDDYKIKPETARQAGFTKWITSGSEGYGYYANYNRMSEQQKQKWDAAYGPMNKQFLENTPKGSELLSWKYQRFIHDYLATVASIDDSMGRLLDYLDKNNLSENTIVVYTSDQGYFLGEHGWHDKRWMYEESLRSPLLIRYPGKIKAGSVADEIVMKEDLAPTFLDYAGVDIPESIQGKSLRPILESKGPQDWREALYYHYYAFPAVHDVDRHYGVRTDRYKLIHFYYDDDLWELYDLKKDPYELTNQINNPEYDRIETQLRKKLISLRDKYGETDAMDQRFIDHYLEKQNEQK